MEAKKIGNLFPGNRKDKSDGNNINIVSATTLHIFLIYIREGIRTSQH
jgi:hypothetical protein